MNVTVSIPGIEKLVDHVASGIGSVAGPMLAPWTAEREARAKQIAAAGEARTLLIQATAQAEAREILLSRDDPVSGSLDISDRVRQRIRFQERKRQENIESVVSQPPSNLSTRPWPTRNPIMIGQLVSSTACRTFLRARCRPFGQESLRRS